MAQGFKRIGLPLGGVLVAQSQRGCAFDADGVWLLQAVAHEGGKKRIAS